MIILSGGRVYYVRFRQSLIHFCASALRSLMSSTAPARTIHAHNSSCACDDTCSCSTTLQYAQLAPASGLAVSSALDYMANQGHATSYKALLQNYCHSVWTTVAATVKPRDLKAATHNPSRCGSLHL